MGTKGEREPLFLRVLVEELRRALPAAGTAQGASRSTAHPQTFALFVFMPPSRNPFALRSFGSFEKLDERIASLVRCKDLASLYEKVVERLVEEHDKKIVHGLLELALISRHGVSGTELQKRLNVTSIKLSPLLDAMEGTLLLNRAGIYCLGLGQSESPMAAQ